MQRGFRLAWVRHSPLVNRSQTRPMKPMARLLDLLFSSFPPDDALDGFHFTRTITYYLADSLKPVETLATHSFAVYHEAVCVSCLQGMRQSLLTTCVKGAEGVRLTR